MDCDRLAPWYRWLEFIGFGRELERRREQFLAEMHDARRALVLGDGDGRFLAAFLRANLTVEVDYVDSSTRMLALARRQVESYATEGGRRASFHHADAREWPLPTGASYDLIVTHFFLDCFSNEQLSPMFGRIASATTEQARWVVSEFRQPAHGFAAWRARLWIGGLYLFFRLVTGLHVRRLPAYQAMLEAHGFRREHVVTSSFGLLTSELWQRT